MEHSNVIEQSINTLVRAAGPLGKLWAPRVIFGVLVFCTISPLKTQFSTHCELYTKGSRLICPQFIEVIAEPDAVFC